MDGPAPKSSRGQIPPAIAVDSDRDRVSACVVGAGRGGWVEPSLAGQPPPQKNDRVGMVGGGQPARDCHRLPIGRRIRGARHRQAGPARGGRGRGDRYEPRAERGYTQQQQSRSSHAVLPVPPTGVVVAPTLTRSRPCSCATGARVFAMCNSARVRRGHVLRRRAQARAFSVAASLAVALMTVARVGGVAGVAAASAATPSFSTHGSAEQVYVTGLSPNASMSLLRANGATLYTQEADSQGGLLFRNVAPGGGYRVRSDSNGTESGPITVHSDTAAPWDPGIYNQSIPDEGYTYLTTRDGTQLAIDVHPPTSPAGEPGLPLGLPVPPGLPSPSLPISLPGLPGPPSPLAKHAHTSAFGIPPYPTLIEYSGYGYADPSGPVNGIAVLANLMGFAVVDVNMRGTGCSGGAYDFFEPLQNLDAYDVIETIAHQPWVLDHKVGMMGISYGAISQLFTAQLRPPDLEAIAPLSTIDATATTLDPGGILNTGFAVAWAQQRQEEAEPAGPSSGQPYAYQQIQDGDTTCLANQVLHGEAADLGTKIAANAYSNPS